MKMARLSNKVILLMLIAVIQRKIGSGINERRAFANKIH
jgi:hypothetical protein